MGGSPYCLEGISAILCCIAIAAASSCVTPSGGTGKCVPLEHCSNLFAIKQLSHNVTENFEKILTQAECSLKDSRGKGLCCQLERNFRLPDNCGVSSNDRIAHGNKTEVFEYPWMALLMFRDTFSNELVGNCGGTLINERYVLTAAHCFKQDKRFELEYVRLGEHTISEEPDCTRIVESGEVVETFCAPPVENVPFESYIIHPEYRTAFSGNDIALIRLAKAVTFKSHIQPICLPLTANLKDTLLPRYIVSGWGLTEQIVHSDVLLKAALPRVDGRTCQQRINEVDQQKLNITISPKQLCAGGVNLVDSCQGDSGGPLMWPVDYLGRTRFVQFGVVSYGIDSCGAVNFPAVYARVGSYMVWIILNMKA
ncbi:serine protease grass-like [Wyeomyia smithii]|uniref:serine protease grass-like n=1 Tax=Wyeomyia smithii TaxID=174621 RepID=UPI002467DACA|nr:serine protease grass-like [Wyeomyia smithii]